MSPSTIASLSADRIREAVRCGELQMTSFGMG
jgi:hypothetical protein